MTGTLAPEAPAEPQGGLTWQKLFLGDWSRIVRDPLDVYRILFVAGTVVWGLSGRPVAVLVAAGAVLLLARFIDLPRFYDFSLIVILVLVAWGEVLGLYDSWKGYDNVVHFTVPFLLTGMVYVILVRLGVLPELSDLKQVHQKFGFFLTAVLLGMAIGAGWEIVEWSLDEWAGSNLVGTATDTATDLIWDTMGATLSAIVLTLWSLGGHSLRRRPGAALAEQEVRQLPDAPRSMTPPGIDAGAPVVGRSEIEIAAAPEVAWDVLTAIDRWPSWNPAVRSVSVEGAIDEGSVFRWKAGPGTITSTITYIQEPRRIAWNGTTFGLRATHVHTFEPRGGGTFVTTEESWDGPVARLFPGRLRKQLGRSLRDGLQHLKAEAERRGPAP